MANSWYFQPTGPADTIGHDSDFNSTSSAHHNSVLEDYMSEIKEYVQFAYYLPDLSAIRKDLQEDVAFWPTIIVYGATFLFGVIGNGLVILAVLLDRRSRNTTTSFMVSLAVADLIFLLICAPYETALRFSLHWEGGTLLCKMAAFVEMLSAAASILNLTAVSVERYIVIAHPMRSRSLCSVSVSRKTILGVWVVAIFLSCPLLSIMKTTVGLYYNNETYVMVRSCLDTNVRSDGERLVFAWYQLLIMFVAPFAVMIFCYSAVVKVLWISTRCLEKLTQSSQEMETTDSRRRLTVAMTSISSHDSGRWSWKCKMAGTTHADLSVAVREARKQVIRMLLTIIVIFFICWGPKFILNLMKRHDTTFLHQDAAFYMLLVINLLPYMQSCLNPVIYFFMSTNFRWSIYSVCRQCNVCGCRHKSRLIQRTPRSFSTAGKMKSLTTSYI